MKMLPFIKKHICLCTIVIIALTLTSCNDDTNDIGQSVMPGQDLTQTSDSLYYAFSQSVRIDSLVANTTDCYLGKVTDPETGSTTISSFLAQFYNLENYSFPDKDSMMCDENGFPFADSVDIHLYIESYYGDSLNSMKIAVQELDSTNIPSEDNTYYTNFKADNYLSKKEDAIYKETTFSVTDLNMPDSLRGSDGYSRHIRIKLPTEYGTKIINRFYEHPEYFKNAYQFIRHVMPGFYFKTIAGNGTLINCDVATVNIYFRYTYNDSIYNGIQRVASTGEVLQNNTIENKGFETLINDTSCTYIKTPAGLFTEVVLPLDSIFEGHEQDSLNSAKIILKRINNNQLNKYNLSTADQLMIIDKTTYQGFFENKKLPNGKTAIITSFNSSYNSYTYQNIATLVSHMYNNMLNQAGITSSDSPSKKAEKKATWIATHPEWNKVLLVPVSTETNAYGAYTKVSHNLKMTSTRLLGGKTSPIQVSTVYSRFKK